MATTTTHPKAYISTAAGTKLVLPFAPREVEHSGWTDTWATLSRPGRSALVVRAGDGLPQMSMTVILGRADHQTSVEGLISTLKKIAQSGLPCTVSHGPTEGGTWVMSNCRVTSQLRQNLTNEITRAEAQLTFIAAGAAQGYKTGPITAAKPKPKAPKHAARWVTVKRGDTLARLAAKYLGDANDWRKIANNSHNKSIRNPNRLAVGQRVYIPAG